MKTLDTLSFGFRALSANRTRSTLMLLAMSMGVAAVIVLTSLGEGARRYVVGQFSSLGTDLLIMMPGRAETTGALPPLLGETPRDLTLDDSLALYREKSIQFVAPIIAGSAPVSYRQLERELTIVGTTSEYLHVRKLSMRQGKFLTAGDPDRATPECVLGDKAKQELFGQQSALGKWLRINDRRFRVIGVLKSAGAALGAGLNDAAIINVVSAQALFNSESMFRVLVQAKNRDVISVAQQAMIEIIRERHDGEDDVTVIQQDALLATFDKIFTALNFAVAGIAAISLAVAGVLIMNVMLIAVSQRTHEIGLLKAIGAHRHQIIWLFLLEAALLASAGATFGMIFAYLASQVLTQVMPNFPISIPLWSPLVAAATAVLTGLVFGLLPARNAARLDPVTALVKR